MARAAGRPLIPWQREVAWLTGERLESGRLAYPRVVMVVPRRAGKSVLVLARALATIRNPGRRAVYMGAHRENAARLWRDEWFPILEGSALHPYVKLTRGNGTESVRLKSSPSTFRLVAANGDSIRNAAVALTVVDEARDIDPDTGDDLEGAALPTMATTGGQLWVISSAGHLGSQWLARWRDRGRAAVEAGYRDRLAYVEFSAPTDSDPDDEATWWAAHPGLGHHVDIDALRADHDPISGMTAAMFAAEYLGWWPETTTDTKLVEAWSAAAARTELADPVVFAVEVDEDRTTAAIVAAGLDGGGRLGVELVDVRPLGPWVAPRLVELCGRWDPVALVWDRGGPANALAPELVTVPTRTVPLGALEMTAAAGSLYDAVLSGALWHRADATLDAAVATAQRRRAGGSWLFDRRAAGSGPLIAAAMAAWIHRTGGRPPTIE